MARSIFARGHWGLRSLSTFSEIYLYRDFVDLRKSYGSLSILAQSELGAEWGKSQLFIFTNRRRNLIKLLYYDRTGFAIWMKRLERWRYPWPRDVDKVLSLSTSDLEEMLYGVNIWSRHKEVLIETVF